MLVKLDSPEVLAKGVDIISDLVTEVRMKINEHGLSIVAMDPANVAMVGFKIPKSSFSQFEADEEALGVNLGSLKQILRRCGKGSLIMQKEENVLKITIEDRIRRNFSLMLIEIESEDKEMKQLEYSSKIELSSNDLIAALEDVAVVDDACSFIVKEGKFIIEAKGLNAARVEFSSDEALIEAEDCKSRYSLEYLQKFMKASKIVDKTVLKFASDHPLEFAARNEFFEIRFLLAPRTENED